jgi:hypothetical protein
VAKMETKLTLKYGWICYHISKKYAEQKHRSLSRLVETYFKNLTEKGSPKQRYSPLVKSLIGTISKEPLNDLLEEDLRAKWIMAREV